MNLLQQPERCTIGDSYAVALLTILGIHEMGRYLVARRRGVGVSLPYFIPVPTYLGTFGAFIRMRGAVRDRSAYFDVAIAGPSAGWSPLTPLSNGRKVLAYTALALLVAIALPWPM